MMRLKPQLVPGWPKLTWVARFEMGLTEVEVLHGPMVETANEWVVEAVWAGDFDAGNFDQTDLIFGTGIRCRDGAVTFVSSGSTLDRLWHGSCGRRRYVSNSLGALLAVSGSNLLDTFDYATPMKSICRGLREYRREFPTDGENVNVLYFNNLQYDGTALKEVEKPDVSPDFETFSQYHSFLIRTAEQLRENLGHPRRKTPVATLTTLSSGYDSVAASIVAMHAGCEHAVTIRDSTSLWRGSDSGESIGERLGLHVRSYARTARQYPLEAAIWAVVGRPGILNWALFEYPAPLGLFFTGCHGDKVWDRQGPELSDPFEIASVADLGIGEFRLFRGVFHCPVPFWGMRKIDQIRAVSTSAEMARWTLGTTYDRPIARRIIEEAGIPRGTFAVRKKNTSLESRFLWPVSPDARASFAAYLAEHGIRAPSATALGLMRCVENAYSLFRKNLPRLLRTLLPSGLWENMASQRLLFQWANHVLQAEYAQALPAAQVCRRRPLRGKWREAVKPPASRPDTVGWTEAGDGRRELAISEPFS